MSLAVDMFDNGDGKFKADGQASQHLLVGKLRREREAQRKVLFQLSPRLQMARAGRVKYGVRRGGNRALAIRERVERARGL